MSSAGIPNGLTKVLAYHQATKHHFHVYARGPGYLDWTTQPDPFRRYVGAPLIKLEHIQPGQYPSYDRALLVGNVPTAPLNRHTLSQLLFDSLAISAWKQAGDVSWALRVNPSSGNLHPTEGYVICGPIDGLCEGPLVGHYAPKEHALEVRGQFPTATWHSLMAELPRDCLLVGLTSIHWREAWKYGERAFRYCQHDVGHAIAAVSIAAGGLGWQATLLDDVGTVQLASLFGVFDNQDAESEHPNCLLAVHPQGEPIRTLQPRTEIMRTFAGLSWQGKPNQLSPSHVDWSLIDDVAKATMKPATAAEYDLQRLTDGQLLPEGFGPGLDASAHCATDDLTLPQSTTVSLRQIIHRRRSAVEMDGRTSISRDAFYRVLYRLLADPARIPFNALPWSPRIHLVFFVHRVQDLKPGLYVLVRAPSQRQALEAAMKDEFVWQRPHRCPEKLEFFRLTTGDVRALARQLSCHQEIAADGCFSVGMIADLEDSLQSNGAWFYPRLFWESGAIGQALYLAAEAEGLRGTGIGCFFDDPVHTVLGLDPQDLRYQSLYHFTAGTPVEDTRLTTLPAYPEMSNAQHDTLPVVSET